MQSGHAPLNQSTTESEPTLKPRRPYEPPRIEKRRSLKRVTLITGMGVAGMSVISTMI